MNDRDSFTVPSTFASLGSFRTTKSAPGEKEDTERGESMAGAESTITRDAHRRRTTTTIIDGSSDDAAVPEEGRIQTSRCLYSPLDDDDDDDLKGDPGSTCDQHNGYSASMSLKERVIDESSERDNLDIGSQAQAAEPELLHHSKYSEDAIQNQNPAAGVFNARKLSEITSIVRADECSAAAQTLRKQNPACFFTAKELSSSIIASQSTRIFCSILIALLVVLSYVDYPMLGINVVNSKSIIAAKPLYMLLLTDVTILVGHLILVRWRRRIDPHDEEDIKFTEADGGLNWARAVRILERGLVFHQTISAIFVDCSLYVLLIHRLIFHHMFCLGMVFVVFCINYSLPQANFLLLRATLIQRGKFVNLKLFFSYEQ
ncbi:hypothetical protein Dimus_004338 [Dionaea muscipula]